MRISGPAAASACPRSTRSPAAASGAPAAAPGAPAAEARAATASGVPVAFLQHSRAESDEELLQAYCTVHVLVGRQRMAEACTCSRELIFSSFKQTTMGSYILICSTRKASTPIFLLTSEQVFSTEWLAAYESVAESVLLTSRIVVD